MNAKEAKKYQDEAIKKQKLEQDRIHKEYLKNLEDQKTCWKKHWAKGDSWNGGVDAKISEAAKAGKNYIEIQISGDCAFKREYVTKWAKKSGFAVSFSQESFSERDRDNETGQESGGYWFQWATISW